jgi:two-component system response regulator HydG
LYQPLTVSTLRVPSLVERREDIPQLIEQILGHVEHDSGFKQTLTDEALQALLRYRWPGNVRELESVIIRACLRSSDSVLRRSDLPSLHLDARQTERIPHSSFSHGTLAEVQKLAILRTMEQVKGNRLLAAKLLGIGRSTLYRKLSEYGLIDSETPDGATLKAATDLDILLRSA